MNRCVCPIAGLGWFSSLAIHVAAATWLLQPAHGERTRMPPATVTLSVVSPTRVHRPSPAVPERSKAQPDKTLAPSSTTKVTRKPPNEITPAGRAPVDLTGVTLTGGDGAGWASMTGNGLSMDTPIRPTVATAATNGVIAASGPAKVTRAAPSPIEVVPARDLASKPMPPALNANLLANYPPLAKRQGLAGNAKLLVRIDSDGVVRQCTIQSASSIEFGTACRQTLLGSRWSTPRDRMGNAVITQVYYTCDFRVNGS